MLLGGFGIGGPLPVNMFKGAYWAFGWAAYLTPVALAYWGVYKFKAEDGQIPLSNFVGMLAVLFFASGWSYTALAGQERAGQTGPAAMAAWWARLFGNAVLTAISQVPAALIFFVFTVLSIFFAFKISPKVLLGLADLFKRPEGEESELAALKNKAAEAPGFKLTEGVPVEHHSPGRAKAETARP